MLEKDGVRLDRRIVDLEIAIAEHNTNTEHILKSIDDIKNVLSSIVDIQKTIVENDASTKSAHRRISTLESRIKSLENLKDKALWTIVGSWIAAIGAFLYNKQ